MLNDLVLVKSQLISDAVQGVTEKFQRPCRDIPHDRQSPGVGIQATARYIHVRGNPTIRYLVRRQQLLLRPPQHVLCTAGRT
jgi:hypothetical protein